MGTTKRIFDMMRFLCQVRHATMTELAGEFGVSVRTIKRDIDELGYLIPIKTKMGRYEGGVYVIDNYKWDKAYMSVEDIALLVRIKTIGTDRKRLVLEDEDLQRLERLIVTYSMPKGK